MSIKALKAHLVTKPEKELLQEIVKLYQQFSVVRDFYDSQISAEGANDVLSKYKKILCTRQISQNPYPIRLLLS